MSTTVQQDIDRLINLRRRAIDAGFNESKGDRQLIRLLDNRLADLYAKRVAPVQDARE